MVQEANVKGNSLWRRYSLVKSESCWHVSMDALFRYIYKTTCTPKEYLTLFPGRHCEMFSDGSVGSVKRQELLVYVPENSSITGTRWREEECRIVFASFIRTYFV
jgi:hypothetical protein